jgi:hypothetical protein
MSYYHRALEKLETMELQLMQFEAHARPAARLLAVGLRKSIQELRDVLVEWRYEPEEHLARQQAYADDEDEE